MPGRGSAIRMRRAGAGQKRGFNRLGLDIARRIT